MGTVRLAVTAVLFSISGPLIAASADARPTPTTIGFTSGSVRETFVTTPTGGIEEDVVIVPDAGAVVRLRSETRKRVKAFARGNFVDPTNPHGDLVPGLREMRRQWSKMHVRYEDVPKGARVHYMTTDPVMVEALHQWFTARAIKKVR